MFFDLNSTPLNLKDCFDRWIKTFQKHDKKLVLVGVSAPFLSFWKCRNDRKKLCDPMMLLKLMCNWINDWSMLQIKDREAKLLTLGAKLVQQVANEVYRTS